MLKKLIKQHKRVIFDGDNYSEEWHAEAERRGLPNGGLGRSVPGAEGEEERGAVPEVRRPDKVGATSRRMHIAVEKYVKQLTIEAETMVSIARSQILPGGAGASAPRGGGGGGHQGGRAWIPAIPPRRWESSWRW